MKKPCILIVGGAGYIGSHMLLNALESGYECIVLDDLSLGSREAVIGGTFYEGDLADRDLLQGIFQRHAIDVVLHFAAFIRVDESVTNPGQYYANNVCKTVVLLDEMINAGIKRFIFSSTAAVYGTPSYVPIDLTHPCHPINPYGRSKHMVELLLHDYQVAYGLQSLVFRYFNAAGCDPQGRIGFHEPATHLIAQVLKAASGRIDQLEIYGSDYETRDGTCIRDYIHVNDLISAHALGVEQLMSTTESGLYNLGTGTGFSVLEVIREAEIVIGRKIPLKKMPRRQGDPACVVAESGLATNVLGWKPTCSDLPTLLRDAWLWETSHAWDK